MRLEKILHQILNENTDKSILTSNPNIGDVKKFNEITGNLMKLLKNSQMKDRKITYNSNDGSNLFTPPTVAQGDISQHMGEYTGEDFKGFSKKIAQLYEKSGFKVKEGYGIDDINGFEVYTQDGNVVGEVDFLEKGSVLKLGHTVIVKHKR